MNKKDFTNDRGSIKNKLSKFKIDKSLNENQKSILVAILYTTRDENERELLQFLKNLKAETKIKRFLIQLDYFLPYTNNQDKLDSRKLSRLALKYNDFIHDYVTGKNKLQCGIIGSKNAGAKSLHTSLSIKESLPYCEKMYLAALELGYLIKQKKRDLNYAWNFLSKKRQEVAWWQQKNTKSVLYTQEYTCFGSKRTSKKADYSSSIPLHLWGVRKFNINKFKSIRSGQYVLKRNEAKQVFVEKTKIPSTNESIILTRTTVIYDKKNLKLYKWMWDHTKTRDVKKIMAYTDTVFKNVTTLTKHYRKSSLINEVAEIHWWLSHAMPNLRGSAGITDALTKAIFMLRSYGVSTWKKWTKPDIEAFKYSRSRFKSKYAKLFT